MAQMFTVKVIDKLMIDVYCTNIYIYAIYTCRNLKVHVDKSDYSFIYKIKQNTQSLS